MEMTIQEILKVAAIDTVLGMGTVFGVLILISLCIWALGVALKKDTEKESGAATAAAAAQAAAHQAKAAATENDGELVAAISAAINQFLKNQYGEEIDESQYIVRNIRRATWKHTS